MQALLGVSDAAWNGDDFDRINEALRQQTAADAPVAVRAMRDAVWQAVLAAIGGLSDERLAAAASGSGLQLGPDPSEQTLGELLGEHWGGHYREHLGSIKALIESPRD